MVAHLRVDFCRQRSSPDQVDVELLIAHGVIESWLQNVAICAHSEDTMSDFGDAGKEVTQPKPSEPTPTRPADTSTSGTGKSKSGGPGSGGG